MATVGYVYGRFQKLLLDSGWRVHSHSPGEDPLQRIVIFKRGGFEWRIERFKTWTCVTNGHVTFGYSPYGKFYVFVQFELEYCSDRVFWSCFEETIY